MRFPKTIILALAAGVSLGGCMYDGYGSGGIDAGYGYGGGYYDDPYYAGGSPYGWWDGYYYPGTGYYVIDRDGRRHRWNDRQRQYWEGRRHRGDGDGRWSEADRQQWRDRRERRDATAGRGVWGGVRPDARPSPDGRSDRAGRWRDRAAASGAVQGGGWQGDRQSPRSGARGFGGASSPSGDRAAAIAAARARADLRASPTLRQERSRGGDARAAPPARSERGRGRGRER